MDRWTERQTGQMDGGIDGNDNRLINKGMDSWVDGQDSTYY